MLKEEDLTYFKNGEIENIKFWKRLGSRPDFKDKKILDFGCGHGSLAINIANSGAKKVVGIDLSENLINFANENLSKNFSKLEKIVSFEKIDLLQTDKYYDFDYIVSKDTFEHSLNLDKILNKFNSILKINGEVYIGFGPLYNFYNGDHGRLEAILPWFHLIIPERILIKRINKKYKKCYNDVRDLGLSKYSFKDYEQFFKDSKFKISFLKTNFSDHPISKIFNFFSKFKFLKEYFTYNIYCILKKN